MTTLAATARSTGGVTAWIKQHPLLAYFTAMYAITWIVFLPLLLSSEGLGVLPVTFPHQLFTSLASIIGLTFPALLLAGITGGWSALRQFIRRFVEWRVGVGWYLFALIGAPVIYLFSAALFAGPGADGAVIGQGFPGVAGYFGDVLQRAVTVNLWEEAGLMAFPFILMQRRYGAVKASLALGPLWALMHLPATLIPGMVFLQRLTPPALVMNMVMLIILSLPVRIILTWLFNNTKGSLLFIALFHSTFDQTTGPIAKLIPAFNPLGGIAAYVILALLLVILTRGRLSYKPENEQTATGSPEGPNRAQP